MLDSKEKIKSTIAKLLAKAESTKNQHEAAAFMAKVGKMLEEHQISLYEVKTHGISNSDPMGKERGTTRLYASASWALLIATSLAHFYGCEFVYRKDGKNTWNYDVVGRESARTTFELMFPYVLSQVKLLAKQMGTTASKAERDIGKALAVRIAGMVEAAKERREELTGRGLIPVSDLEAALRDLFSNLKVNKAKRVSYSWEAQELAEKVKIHKQITSKEKKLLG
jgi:hypothetical protein